MTSAARPASFAGVSISYSVFAGSYHEMSTVPSRASDAARASNGSTLSASAAYTGHVFCAAFSGRTSWTLPSCMPSPAVVPFSPVETAPPERI